MECRGPEARAPAPFSRAVRRRLTHAGFGPPGESEGSPATSARSGPHARACSSSSSIQWEKSQNTCPQEERPEPGVKSEGGGMQMRAGGRPSRAIYRDSVARRCRQVFQGRKEIAGRSASQYAKRVSLAALLGE